MVPILVEIEITERLLTAVLTDEWAKNFYPLITTSDVAGHLAFNLIQDRRLSSLDGFADQPEDAARILDITTDETEIEELPRHELLGGTVRVKKTSHGRKYNWQCSCGAGGKTWQSTPRSAQHAYRRHLATEM